MSSTPSSPTVPSDNTLDLSPISRQQVPEQVARQLQQFIARRKLRSGDRLAAERDLAAALQVSRSAVREGVKLLAAYGVVEVRQGVGTFVKEPQQLILFDPSLLGSEERRHMLVQATSVRKLIECEIAAQAAVAATEGDLSDLRACLLAADEEPERTRRAFAIDLSFEVRLAQATGNPYLVAVQRAVHRFFKAAWEGCGFIPRPAEERSQQHWEIFEAVAAHAPERARALMDRHLGVRALAGNAGDDVATVPDR